MNILAKAATMPELSGTLLSGCIAGFLLVWIAVIFALALSENMSDTLGVFLVCFFVLLALGITGAGTALFYHAAWLDYTRTLK